MTAPSCARCAEKYAGDPAALGTTPVLDAALDAGALAAGWQQDEDGWTCTVCLAKPTTADAPDPEAVPDERETPPDTDPYDQSLAILGAFDARVPGFWSDTNNSNNLALRKIGLRFSDGTYSIADLPGLTDDERDHWFAALRREAAALEAARSEAA